MPGGRVGGLDVAPDGMVYFGAKNPHQRQRSGRAARSVAGDRRAPRTASPRIPVADNPAHLLHRRSCATSPGRRRTTACTSPAATAWSAAQGRRRLQDDSSLARRATVRGSPPRPTAAPGSRENGSTTPPNWSATGSGTSPRLAVDGRHGDDEPRVPERPPTVDSLRYDPRAAGHGRRRRTARRGSPRRTPATRLPDRHLGRRRVHGVLPAVRQRRAVLLGRVRRARPPDVTVAQDGSLWYTNEFNASIGHLVPGGTRHRVQAREHGARRSARAAPTGDQDGGRRHDLGCRDHGGYSALPTRTRSSQINPTSLTKTIYKFGTATAAVRGRA